MTINIANAAAAYANAGKIALTGPSSGAASGGAASGGGFADLLARAADDSIDTLRKSESVSMQAAAGKADLTDVVTAVTNAEVTLQTVAALRDRMISAYQEILRMPI
jgi:flagellar hook-basal body complex protein FliE